MANFNTETKGRRLWSVLRAGLATGLLMLAAFALGKPAALAQQTPSAPQGQTPQAQTPQPRAPQPVTPMRPDQQLSAANGIIRLFDSVLLYPLPDWTELNTSKALQSSRFNRRQQPGVFSLEAIPIEETFQDWKNLYALLAIQNFRGGPGRNLLLAQGNFEQGCAEGTVRMVRGTAREGVPTLLVACGAYANAPALGEVGVFVFLQRGSTAVRLYREWRGPAFDPEDTAAWPVQREELMRVFNQLQAARLTAQ